MATAGGWWRAAAAGVFAIVVSASVFVVHHTFAMAIFMPGWVNAVASVGIFIGGAMWSWLYLRYRSIYQTL